MDTNVSWNNSVRSPYSERNYSSEMALISDVLFSRSWRLRLKPSGFWHRLIWYTVIKLSQQHSSSVFRIIYQPTILRAIISYKIKFVTSPQWKPKTSYGNILLLKSFLYRECLLSLGRQRKSSLFVSSLLRSAILLCLAGKFPAVSWLPLHPVRDPRQPPSIRLVLQESKTVLRPLAWLIHDSRQISYAIIQVSVVKCRVTWTVWHIL
jgi:hypothetical protein